MAPRTSAPMAALLPLLLLLLLLVSTVRAWNPNGIWFDRVIIVIFENEDADTTLLDPNFQAVAARGRYLSSYSAISHPSQPNYVAMVAGDTLGVNSDDAYNLGSSNLMDLLDARGVSWKVYAENQGHTCNLDASDPAFPTPCGSSYANGTTKGAYARKHNPLVSFTDVTGNATRCANLVDASQLEADAAANVVPQVVMYIPTLCNDGHDTNVAYAGSYLAWLLDHRLTGNATSGPTLTVLTFDEGSDTGPNLVWTTLLASPGFPKAGNASAAITPGSSVASIHYSHYSVLRTMEDNWGLGSLGRHDATAQALL